ncbi:MAG: hypothetical protein H6719_36360 [Sandaracinaceae bacterium]|nr:hypothetical protein [Sandaracinaceae bacterium]
MASNTTRAAGLTLVLFASACAGSSSPTRIGATHEDGVDDETMADASGAPTSDASPRRGAAADPPGDIPFWSDGTAGVPVTEASAARRGLTLLDLGEGWTPTIFTEDPELGPRGHQPYRRHFVRYANEEERSQRDPTERYLELYGISPSFAIVRARLADEERHRCHEAVDDSALGALDDALRPGADPDGQRRRVVAVRVLRRRLEGIAARRHLASIDDFASNPSSREGQELRRLQRMEPVVHAIQAVQAHLRCEGTLSSRSRDGVLDAWTGRALRIWQSRHMIISLASRVDEATRASLMMDSRELDFMTLLRALRERVVDATGIIEDGSASNQWGTVLGRQLQIDDEFRGVGHLPPRPNGAPDLVSRETEAAARALGWTDPAAALAWLNEHAADRADHRVVALPLPPPPAYHSAHMDLHVEIDRGDVYYAFPYTSDGRPRGVTVRNRPVTTIFARYEGRDIPLVRWNTTIGGWQPEVNPEGGVGLRYKESDVGPRVWRDLVAGPAWLPPPNTPDDELLQRSGGQWRVNRSITGPGYDSAYGLAMVIHHQVRGEGEDAEYIDNGIRSHGSVSYRSILRGNSHGCHRLFNHLAVRMGGFLLHHRTHRISGRIPASLRRELTPEGSDETLVLELDNRGFLFELDPPVPVEVLAGNIRGGQQRPLAGFFPLPEELQAAARAEAEADPNP